MDMPFLKKHLYVIPQFLGRDGNLFRTILSYSKDEMAIPELGTIWYFLGRDCHFFRTSVHFVIIGGMWSNYLGGGVHVPPSPCFGTAG